MQGSLSKMFRRSLLCLAQEYHLFRNGSVDHERLYMKIMDPYARKLPVRSPANPLSMSCLRLSIIAATARTVHE